MPSVDWNRDVWNDRHGWAAGGDEWSGMAAHCGQPYELWKRELVSTFILPYAAEADVLEIAPGHGRWSAELLAHARHLAVVDISPACIDACKERFTGRPNVSYHLGEGSSIPQVAEDSTDFVWSFDSFVHMELPVIDGYLAECARVLRPGGRLVIHHAGQRGWSLALVPLTSHLGLPGRVLQRLAGQGRLRDSGQRAAVSREAVAHLVRRHGLHLDVQTDAWGTDGRHTVAKYRDCITVASKPAG